MKRKNEVLRCYFVGIHDCVEIGGLATFAYNARDAKRFVWNNGELCDNEFTDLRVKWLKKVLFDRIPKHHQIEGHILDMEEGYRSGAYKDWDGDACSYCGGWDCEELGCAVLEERQREAENE